ncbi:MAG TPA: FAD-dependent oxidoreductase [Chloroflexota bacterium]
MELAERQASGRRVVIAGASFAGLGAAYALRRKLPKEDRVTVIAPTESFTFAPSLIWAAMGHTLRHSSFAIEPALGRKGIEFVRSHVRGVQVHDHTVLTDDGGVQYDRLVIATGGRPNTTVIPGLAGELRAASWIVGEDSALETRNVLRALADDPGPLVVGVAQGASYISAAYELALALDTALRQHGIRDRVPITFVTAEPYLGHLGFGQTAARRLLEKLFAQRDIAVLVSTQIEHIRAHEITLSTRQTLPARAIIIMPPFTGSVDIWKSAELTDETGLIPVEASYRHTKHEDVYACGVASYFQQPIPPLGFGHPPHTGYLSLHMGKTAGQNVAASLGCGSLASRALPHVLDVRVLNGGRSGVLLISRGDTELRNTARKLPGTVAHVLKASIERYLVWRLRTGRIDLP